MPGNCLKYSRKQRPPRARLHDAGRITRATVLGGPVKWRPLRKSVLAVAFSIFADPEGQKILAGGDNHRLNAKSKPLLEGRKKGGKLRGKYPLPAPRGGLLVGVVTGGCHHRLISPRASVPPDRQQPFRARAFARGTNSSRARAPSRPCHTLASAVIFILLSCCCLVASGADTPAPSPPKKPIIHLTDEQDRLGSGKLDPVAEARSKANALYAEAMLLPDDLAGDEQNALDLFRQIVALDPTFTEAQIKLANLYLQSGQTDQALAQLQTAAAAHPESVPIQVALGYTMRLRGDNDDAVRLCTRALARDCTQTLAMRVLLDVASDQDDLAGAVLHIEDILKRSPDVPAAVWLNFAQLYVETARGERFPPPNDVILRTRLPILQQAAAIPPPDVGTLTLLSDTYRELGRKIDALNALQRAAALEPANFTLALHCADLEFALGQTADATRDYEKAYALNPTLPGLREMLGGLYLDSARYDDATRLLEAALADAPQDASLLIDLGLAHEGAHHPDQAQACFKQVFDSAACPPEAYLTLAYFQREHNDLKQAARTLASAQARFPQSAKVRFYEAIQHRYEKDYPAALACLAQVRTLATGAEAGVLDPDYYIECAMTLNLAGKMPQLEAILQEALAKFPDNAELMNELAYYWADQGRHLPEALALSRHATSLEPDDGAILDTYGWVYFQLGQAKDALPYLQRAAVMTNNDPVVLQHVGDAYSKLGLRREAIAAWSRALEKDPRNGDLANRIDAAQAQAKNAQLRSAPRP